MFVCCFHISCRCSLTFCWRCVSA